MRGGLERYLRASTAVGPAAAMAAIAGSGAAQQFGAARVVSNHLVDPRTVVAVDFDGDGDRDVVSASRGDADTDNRIAWFENTDGTGTFGGAEALALLDSTDLVRAADLDGDGDPDLLVHGGAAVSWYANDGLGAVGAPAEIVPASVTSLGAEDFDGDGDQDVHLLPSGGVSWATNDGAGSFGPETAIGTVAERGTRTGDVDGDGDADLCAFGAFSIAWYENDLDTTGAFEPREVLKSESVFTFAFEEIALGDLDLDGDLDFVAVDVVNDQVSWYPNVAPGGPLGAEIPITGDQVEPAVVEVADLDRDGAPDVVCGSRLGGELAWYRNGLGSFGPPNIVSSEEVGVEALGVADLDGDGAGEILSACRGGGTGLPGNGNLAWFRNDGSGGLGPQELLSTSTVRSTAVIVVDLDGDADRDVVTSAEGHLQWFENGGGGEFALARNLADGGAWLVDAVDVDLDGDVDLVDHDGDRIRWHANDGATQFASSTVYEAAIGQSIRAVAVGDLSGDGAPDLVTTSTGPHLLEWIENVDGAGTFGTPQGIPTSSTGMRWCAVGDVEGDGDLDVLLASAFDDRVTWYENVDGAGTMSAANLVASISNPVRIAVGDVEGDGDLDVVVSTLTDFVGYSRRKATGEYSEFKTVTTDLELVSSIHLADGDVDGRLDVFATSAGDGNPLPGDGFVTWFRKETGVTYAPLELLDVLDDPADVWVGDLDGDGDPDAVVAGGDTEQVRWYPNLACDGTAVEALQTVRLGAPPNPDVLHAAGGSKPVIGTTWQPAIDHTTFVPSSVVDLLLVTAAGTNVDLGFPGTLLCDLTGLLLTLQNASPAEPFAIPVSFDCAAVGFPVCVQGASIGAGAQVELTNALDVTIGSY